MTRRTWDRSGSLWQRVYLLVGLGMVVPAVLVGWAAWGRLTDLDWRFLEARRRILTAVAERLDHELNSELEILQQVGSAPGVNLADGDTAPERSALRNAYAHFRYRGAVFLLDGKGRVLAEEPQRADAASLAPALDSPEVKEALSTGRPTFTGVVGRPGEEHVYALVAVRDWHGAVVGIAGAAIDPETPHLASALAILRRGPGAIAELVDATGRILVSSDPSRSGQVAECRAHLTSLVAERLVEARRCRECHTEVAGQRVPREVHGFAPLGAARWGLRMRQPEQDVLATAGAVPTSFFFFAVCVVALSGLFAWGATRSVTVPVTVLTLEAERIAAGDLDRPIPDLGADEVGRLARTFEHTRQALKESLGRVERANHELEERVEQRTRELAWALDQLKQREASRAELLRKVIHAQEDERKRVARELHDETSQSLAVLVMGLETAAAAIKAGVTPRLDEVKSVAVRTLEDVHRLILDLRPSVLDDLGLVSAIRWYAERMLVPRGITVRCEFEKLDRRLPPELETPLFRVCQEAMNNIARHADAESVLIQVNVSADVLRIEIEDDGQGFDPALAGAPGGRRPFGLLGIKERGEILGAKVTIDSSPGQGTRIALEVPLPSAQA